MLCACHSHLVELLGIMEGAVDTKGLKLVQADAKDKGQGERSAQWLGTTS